MLHVKKVTYRARANQSSDALPTLDEMVRGIFAKATTVGMRHYPAPANLKAGKPCICFDDFSDSPGPGILFRVYSYVHSHTPDQLVPDLNATHVSIVAEPLQTSDGKPKAVATSFYVAVLGETMIVEYVAGSGGVAAVIAALSYLGKKRVDHRLANMRAVNIPSRKLTTMIKEKNGVRQVRATLKGHAASDSKYSKSLSTVMKGMGNASTVTTTWAADENQLLAESDVALLWDELDPSDGLTSVSLTFGDGSIQSDIESYQEKREVTVQAVRAGIPVATEIATELRAYMADLMAPSSGTRIIGTNGYVVPISP